MSLMVVRPSFVMSVIASKSPSFLFSLLKQIIYTSFSISFCGLCLQETFRGKTRKKDSHNHVMICQENVHFHNDYYVPEFYPQYCQHRRFAEIWNDMIASDVVSPAIIKNVREKLAPMIQDTNLIFEQDNSGFVNIIFTKEQENQLRAVAPPPAVAAPMIVEEPIAPAVVNPPPPFSLTKIILFMLHNGDRKEEEFIYAVFVVKKVTTEFGVL